MLVLVASCSAGSWAWQVSCKDHDAEVHAPTSPAPAQRSARSRRLGAGMAAPAQRDRHAARGPRRRRRPPRSRAWCAASTSSRATTSRRRQVLVQLNADAEIAQQHALQAAADLAATVYDARPRAAARESREPGPGRRRRGRPASAKQAQVARSRPRWSPRRRSARRSPAAGHHHGQSRAVPQHRRQDRHAADPRPDATSTSTCRSGRSPRIAGRSAREPDGRCLRGPDLRRQDHRDQPQGRSGHPQRADRSHRAATPGTCCCRACSHASMSIPAPSSAT